MQVALSKPLPGESLQSLICRYLDDLGVVATGSTIRRMFGGRTINLRSVCPGALDRLSEATQPYLQMTGRQIAETLTPFPYFAAYVEREVRERALQIMLSGHDCSSNVNGGWGFMSALTCMGPGRMNTDRRFRYCVECVAEDKENDLPPYWRTAHQLPGVVVCWKHQCVLRVVECGDRFGGFSLAHALELPSEDVIAKISESRDALVRIAADSRNLLDLRESLPEEPIQVRIALLEAGVSDAPGRISSPKLIRILIDALGESYLDYVGFRFRDGYAPVRISARGTRREPLNILLLKEAALRRGEQRRGNLRGPICPSLYAAHGPNHRMDTQVVRRREPGIVQWRCECGMSIEFKDEDYGDPTRYRILRHGGAYREKAQQMLAQGTTLKEVARCIGVSWGTVVRWSGEAPPGGAKFESVDVLRREYEKVLADANFGVTLRELKAGHLNLFWQLEILDGPWQKSVNQQYARRRRELFPRRNPRAADWAQRDSIAVEDISLAAARIATHLPAVRMGIGRLVTEARIKVWSPDRMPAASALVHRLKEGVFEFYERAVYLAVCDLRANGLDLTDRNVREAAGERAFTYVRTQNPHLLASLRSEHYRRWTKINDDRFSRSASLDVDRANSVDWPRRDSDAVVSLTVAAAKLAIRVPPIQLSYWNLRREAGISRWSPTGMPEAVAFIERTEESWPEFCERACFISVRRIKCDAQTVTLARIRALAGQRVVGYVTRNCPELLESLFHATFR